MIQHQYKYNFVNIKDDNTYEIREEKIKIKIEPKKNKKIGIMLVGIGGNNGSTFVASILAYQKNIKWNNKNGEHGINFFGSLYKYGNVNIGYKNNKPYTKLMRELVEFYSPDDFVVSGWDINADNMYEACKKNKVLDIDLLEKLKDDLEKIVPEPSIYYENFIAKNQKDRANNIISPEHNTPKFIHSEIIRKDIRDFKIKNNLDNVIVVWTASTERFNKGNWKTSLDLMDAIYDNHIEISPSIIFAVSSILEGCIFINGSPQNTIGSSILDMAKEMNTFVGGEDFKTGQTKLKSVLVDFLASSGIRPLSIVSYNHLGNNDGKNLDEYPQFRSKEITKKNVIDDIVEENPELFNKGKPDHCVVIKYIPSVGDSKRAMDEYYSELFLDGRSTIAIHNTCEDTLLAVPLILDIILFSEFFSRISFELEDGTIKKFNENLSLLSFFFKAPIDDGYPIINSFFKQRYALENFIKICCGIPLNDFINFQNRI